MGKKEDNMDDEMYVTLSLDEGEVECTVITIFEAGQEGEVYLYRYFEDSQGNPKLDDIQSDEEFEIASDKFDEWLDEQEFEDME